MRVFMFLIGLSYKVYRFQAADDYTIFWSLEKTLFFHLVIDTTYAKHAH